MAPGVNAPLCFNAHYNNVADIFTEASMELYIEITPSGNKYRIIYLYIALLFRTAVLQVFSECFVA